METLSTNLSVKYILTNILHAYVSNARTHSKKQVEQIARSIQAFGFNNPLLVDAANVVIAGHGRLLAAKLLGMTEVSIIRLEHLSEAEKKAYILADNRLAEKAGWDKEIIKIELQNLLELDTDFDLTMTGFETPEIDLILNNTPAKENDPIDQIPDEQLVPAKVQPGDLWQLGEHWLYCGDSTKPESFQILMENHRAGLIFTDPPYNVPVQGHVSGKGKIQHAEFAFASGEMSEAEFISFLKTTLGHSAQYSKPGSIHYICMDWRHAFELISVGRDVYAELKNICVWNKQLGGMGSLYRSQHELVFVFKHGTDPHTNNIELGKHGRYRTNIWDYPGAHITNSHGQDLKFHPTVKPVQMIADAIIDCSQQGEIVLDCFGGSGSTILAAERSKRKAYLIEYEPKYCDVALYRFEAMTGVQAKLIQGGRNV